MAHDQAIKLNLHAARLYIMNSKQVKSQTSAYGVDAKREFVKANKHRWQTKEQILKKIAER